MISGLVFASASRNQKLQKPSVTALLLMLVGYCVRYLRRGALQDDNAFVSELLHLLQGGAWPVVGCGFCFKRIGAAPICGNYLTAPETASGIDMLLTCSQCK